MSISTLAQNWARPVTTFEPLSRIVFSFFSPQTGPASSWTAGAAPDINICKQELCALSRPVITTSPFIYPCILPHYRWPHHKTISASQGIWLHSCIYSVHTDKCKHHLNHDTMQMFRCTYMDVCKQGPCARSFVPVIMMSPSTPRVHEKSNAKKERKMSIKKVSQLAKYPPYKRKLWDVFRRGGIRPPLCHSHPPPPSLKVNSHVILSQALCLPSFFHTLGKMAKFLYTALRNNLSIIHK